MDMPALILGLLILISFGLTIVNLIFVFWLKQDVNEMKYKKTDNYQEMKDFHGRLSTIEEKHKNFERKLG